MGNDGRAFAAPPRRPIVAVRHFLTTGSSLPWVQEVMYQISL